jgi:hypothetical protein
VIVGRKHTHSNILNNGACRNTYLSNRKVSMYLFDELQKCLHVLILYILIIHGGVMVRVLASSAVNRGFEHQSGQIKTLKFVFAASPLSTQQ